MDLPVSLEALQEELQRALPEYSYEIKKLLFAKFLYGQGKRFSGRSNFDYEKECDGSLWHSVGVGKCVGG
jgi:hypothetical protein